MQWYDLREGPRPEIAETGGLGGATPVACFEGTVRVHLLKFDIDTKPSAVNWGEFEGCWRRLGLGAKGGMLRRDLTS